MKQLLLLSLFILSLSSNSNAQKASFSFSFGTNYTTAINKQTDVVIPYVPTNSGFSSYQQLSASYKPVIDAKPGFYFGSEVTLPLKSRFSISSGVRFKAVNFNLNTDVTEIGNDLNNLISGGNIISVPSTGLFGVIIGGSYTRDDDGNLILDPNITDDLEIGNIDNTKRNKLYYIDIPISVSYQLVESKISISSGITTSFLTRSVVKYQAFSQFTNTVEIEDTSNDDFNKILFGAQLGIQYNISNTFALEASYQQMINNTYKSDLEISSRQSNFSFGLLYSISKK